MCVNFVCHQLLPQACGRGGVLSLFWGALFALSAEAFFDSFRDCLLSQGVCVGHHFPEQKFVLKRGGVEFARDTSNTNGSLPLRTLL